MVRWSLIPGSPWGHGFKQNKQNRRRNSSVLEKSVSMHVQGRKLQEKQGGIGREDLLRLGLNRSSGL